METNDRQHLDSRNRSSWQLMDPEYLELVVRLIWASCRGEHPVSLASYILHCSSGKPEQPTVGSATAAVLVSRETLCATADWERAVPD